MTLETIEQIVDDLLETLAESDLEYIKSIPLGELEFLHHNFGMHIRNTFGLWTDSILTKNWRENEESRDIRDGVDYSEDHPDEVSGKIMKYLWEKLHTV